MATVPGSTGWPILGETLAFAADGFAFVKDRTSEHGPVVRTNVLFQETFLLSGPEAAAAFADGANIQRDGSMPPHVLEIFGKGAVNQLDGDVHRVRKAHILAAMNREALAAYLPQMRTIMRASVARWVAADEVGMVDEAKRLALDVVSANVLGTTDPEMVVDTVELMRLAAAALGGLPVKLPGTALNRYMKARDRMWVRYGGLVTARRAEAGADGLSRMMQSEIDGERLTDHQVVIEVHHVMLAGFAVWAWIANAVAVLARETELQAALRGAVAGLPDEPSGREVAEVPGLLDFVLELKRATPAFPMLFGKAKQDFVVAGHTVPKGAAVMLGLHDGHTGPTSAFEGPQRFDPGRFARKEHEGVPEAFHPQGSGSITHGHKCAGIDYSTLMMQVYLVELLRGTAGWSLPDQDLGLKWSRIPPEYQDGLRVRFS